MPGGRERALRGRIKSVNSTKKITKAMELIAASRIVKAVSRISSARPYYREMSALAGELRASLPGYAPALMGGGTGPHVVIVVTADRGLCGSYNSAAIREYDRFAANSPVPVEVVGIGRKVETYFKYRKVETIRQFNNITQYPTVEQARAILNPLLKRFSAGELFGVTVISSRFYSIGVQRTERTRLLPMDLGGDTATVGPDFEAEPSIEGATDLVLGELVVAELFGLLLEAAAAEHAARQAAMKSATDNATSLVKTLTRVMNRVRQDAITTEITEIVGGAEALRQAARKKVGDER